ncbi:MAG: class B sortase [Gemmiger sp.]
MKIQRDDCPPKGYATAQFQRAVELPERQTDAANVQPLDEEDENWEEEEEPERPVRSVASRLYMASIIVFAAIFLVSGGMLLKRLWEDRQAENEFANLHSMIAATPEPNGQAPDGQQPDAAQNAAIRFEALKEANADFLGWITLAGTELDLPVMHTGTDRTDYYLRRDFNREYSVYGVPYLDEECTIGAEQSSQNLVIYGHNMKTGTIFGCLTGYKKPSYYEEHPYIQFDTLYGEGTYQVFAAFAIDVVEDPSFAYNTYIDLDEAAYNSYVQQVIARSDVNTGIVPAYGEQLLTLSTCEYSTENGRYVVVARRVGAA